MTAPTKRASVVASARTDDTGVVRVYHDALCGARALHSYDHWWIMVVFDDGGGGRCLSTTRERVARKWIRDVTEAVA